MTPQEKLCQFMEKKYEAMWNNALEWHLDGDDVHPITFPDYYDDEDEASIKSWSDADAQKVIDKLKQRGKEGRWSDINMCPFCQYQMEKLQSDAIDMDVLCADCQYGENHGKCGDDDDATYNYWADYTVMNEEILRVLD